MRIESNRQVPQMNLLSLVVLDMDGIHEVTLVGVHVSGDRLLH